MGYRNRRRRIAAAQNTGQEAPVIKIGRERSSQTGAEDKNLSPATGISQAVHIKKKSSRG